MGLCAMEDAPGADQHLRFANIAGQMSYMAPNAWVGESNLLGLGIDQVQFQSNVNAVTQGVASIAQSIAPLFYHKSKNRGWQGQQGQQGQQGPQATPQRDLAATQPSASGINMTNVLIFGGVAILGVTILYMVLKKKKKSSGDKEE